MHPTLTSAGVSGEQTEAEPAPPAFAGTPRFQVLRPLGAGGMGVVYEVLDREQERTVALKLLQKPSPEGIIRLKDEFRALRDLHHENLVALGELCEHQGTWFFTMERIDGLPLIDRLRQPGVGPGAVRAAFVQVASALGVLHRAGMVHRDIKPANVLCTPAGRVVVLDFGLAVHAYRSVSARAGTRAYMAPEQERDGGPLGPAVDWYSVGVMLYEALVGERPQRHPVAIPPRAPAAPGAEPAADLRALCVALLSPDPQERPGSSEVLRRLGAGGDAAAQVPQLPVLGRQAELQALHAARAAARGSALEVVLLEGESGIGKTALLARFAREVPAQQPDALILQGRCHAQESIPYRAFDEIVDQLGRHLRQLPAQEAAALLPPDAALLAALFPSLAQCGLRLAAAAHRGEPVQRRLAAFAALRELLAQLARRRPVLLLIDDVHWADVDSIVLLRELVRQPMAPPLFVGLAGRPGTAQALSWLPLRRLELGPLPPEAAHSLVQLLRPGSPERAQRLCLEAGGHPLFLSELACAPEEAGGPSLSLVLHARMERLSPHLRALLELLAVAGAPRPQRVLAAAAGMDAERFASAVAELRGQRLVRTVGLRLLDPIEPYHDQIREAASRLSGEERRRHCHRQLALALDLLAIPDEEARAVHWAGAGVPDRARAHALRAAALAEEALAFDRAARLYQMAMRLRPEGSPEEPGLLVKQGEALANARRGPDAAAALLRAAIAVDGQEALLLRLRAGHQLLSSGRMNEGLAVLREVLAVVDVSLPEASVRGIISLLWHRLLLRLRGTRYQLRGEQELAARDLLRIDLLYTVAAGLGWIEPVRAAVLFTRGLVLSLRHGEPYRLTRALLAEAAFTALESIRARDRSAVFLRLGEDLLQRHPAPGMRMGVLLTRSLISFFSGQWQEARTLLELAERVQEGALQGTLAWEMTTLQLYLVYSIIWLGDVREYARRVLLYQREAQERGDLLLATYLGLAAAPVYLAWDQVAQARAAVDDALRDWPQRLDAAYAVAVVTQSEIDLYAGDGLRAYHRIQSHWGVFQRGLLLTVASLRIQVRCARVVSALGAAREAGDAEGRRSLLRVVKRDIRALQREGLPYAAALAQLFCAVALGTQGDRAGALGQLALVIPQLDAAGMSLYSAVARRYQGLLRGDEQGEAQRHQAEDWMREQQIRDPAKMSRCLAGV